MKNPLRKRYGRELRSDFGKYLVIFLFMIMLISLVSGYLVVADSIETTFYEGFDKYNVEDGHITFSKVPEEELLQEIEEKAHLTFTDMEYAEEDVADNGATLRIFPNRETVNKVCLMEGTMPEKADEIAIDRIFAKNNAFVIGDTINLAGKDWKITGLVALVDYGCLFENNSDMMFSATTFGVAIVSKDGYEAMNSSHTFANYAWQYDVRPADDTEANTRSEELQDVLEDVIKDYDTEIIQTQVDDLYDRAEALSDDMETEFENASEEIEDKTTTATEDAFNHAVDSLSEEEKMTLYMAGAQPEEYMALAAQDQNTTVQGLVAAELGTTEEALQEFQDAAEDMEEDLDDMDSDLERPVVSLDEDDEEYDNDMSFSLDGIKDVVAKLEATGLYDTAKLTADINELEELSNFEFDENDFMTLDNYIPRYENKAITYCMDDMGSDKPMYIVFDYIVVVILAFIFAVTISNTITQEAGVIGTLRASGYTRGELVRHYLLLPMLVSFAAAIVGNLLGYTVMVDFYKSIFYNSFCLATYEPRFNSEAFIITTVFPLIIMFVINLIMLTGKMQLTPIQFLRRDLAKKKKRRAMLLNKKIPFMHRFRLRILFQNISAYVTLCIGILFGGLIAVFGWMFGPLLEDYADLIVASKISNYQYVLMEEEETEATGAEKYCITSLDSMLEGYLTDEISIYGIEEDSIYLTETIPEGEVLISNGMADKFDLNPGDTLTLKDPYSDDTYDFVVAGSYEYNAALAVFMNRSEFNIMFDEDEDYFTGYFSNEEIKDIESDKIVTVITEADLTKVSDQLMNSMGSFMSLFQYFGLIMFLLLMYLMTKQIIEKNMQSIAMTKILGFRNTEIAGLYLVMTSIVVIVSLLISVPLIDGILRWIFSDFLYKEVTGYIPYIVSKTCYVKEFVTGVVCYFVVCLFMMLKIGKIKKSEALKNVE